MAPTGRGGLRPYQQSKLQPFIILCLMVTITVIGVNYWSLMKRNSVLLEEISKLKESVKRFELERKDCHLQLVAVEEKRKQHEAADREKEILLEDTRRIVEDQKAEAGVLKQNITKLLSQMASSALSGMMKENKSKSECDLKMDEMRIQMADVCAAEKDKILQVKTEELKLMQKQLKLQYQETQHLDEMLQRQGQQPVQPNNKGTDAVQQTQEQLQQDTQQKQGEQLQPQVKQEDTQQQQHAQQLQQQDSEQQQAQQLQQQDSEQQQAQQSQQQKQDTQQLQSQDNRVELDSQRQPPAGEQQPQQQQRRNRLSNSQIQQQAMRNHAPRFKQPQRLKRQGTGERHPSIDQTQQEEAPRDAGSHQASQVELQQHPDRSLNMRQGVNPRLPLGDAQGTNVKDGLQRGQLEEQHGEQETQEKKEPGVVDDVKKERMQHLKVSDERLKAYRDQQQRAQDQNVGAIDEDRNVGNVPEIIGQRLKRAGQHGFMRREQTSNQGQKVDKHESLVQEDKVDPLRPADPEELPEKLPRDKSN